MPDAIANTLPTAFVFGRFTLDRKRRQLQADGASVKLQARAFDVLECLIERRHRPVGRDEIMTQVWRGQVVAETNLTVQMSNLRRALDEHGGSNLVITVNRSYQFIGDVTEVPPAPPPLPAPVEAPAQFVPPPSSQPQRPAWRAPLLFGLCALMLALAGVAAWRALTAPSPPRLSLAVLPFRYLGAGLSQDYLAEAIGDDLTADLSHIPDSIVIARESTARYRANDVEPVRIGRLLNVRYLVAGTVAVDAGFAHINAELIDTSTGNTLWSDRFDKPVASLSDARDAIVYRIASALNIALDNLEASRSQHDRPNNPDAQDLLFRARAILDAGDSLDDFRKAQTLLKRAIAQQPDFGDAQAELAWLMMRKVLQYDEMTDWVEATSAIDRAQQLVPNNVMVLAARGRQLMSEGRYREAEATALSALQIEPSSLEAQWVVVDCAWFLGELEREDVALQAIARLDPADPKEAKHIALLQGGLAVLLGRPRDALGFLYAAISGDQEPTADDFGLGRAAVTRLWLAAAYALSGDQNKASEVYREFAAIWPNRSVWRFAADELPKAVARQPGALAALKALERSGMPVYSVPAQKIVTKTDSCGDGDYRPTPASLPDDSVADTMEVKRLLASQPPPLVIDISRGAAVIPGAVWSDPANPDSVSAFVDRVVSGSPATQPVILMSSGWTGCDAYNAALQVQQKYRRSVVWYRGGEEAWAQAGLSSTDRRH